MNKNDLIENISVNLNIARSEVEKMLNNLVDIITAALKKGEQVSITGFGQFSVSIRAARTGVNPRHPSQKIEIAATKTPKFRAGKSLKEAVRS